MNIRKSIRFCIFSLLLSGFVFSHFALADDKDSKDRPSRAAEGGREFFGALNDEERTKLREAMKDAWTDPAVVQSREAINESVKAYKASVRAALLKKDPSLEEILVKMEKDSSGHVRQMMGGPPSRGPGHRYDGKGKGGGGPEISPFDRLTRYQPFLSDLPEEKKARYFQVRDQIRDSEEIQSIVTRLDNFNEQDKKLRTERTKLYSELRKTINKKMIEADPTLKELLTENAEKSSFRKPDDSEKSSSK